MISAGNALVLVVLRIDISQTYGKFEIEPLADEPLVAVGKAYPGRPALVAVVSGLRTVERNGHAADIEESITRIDSEEVSVECLTEPVTVLGKYHPVLEFPVFLLVQSPRIIAALETEGAPVSDRELRAEVRRSSQPVQGVGLDRNILCAQFCAAPQDADDHTHGKKCFSHNSRLKEDTCLFVVSA